MSIKSKIKTFFFLDDDEYVEPEEEYEERAETPVKPQKQHLKSQNVVSLQSVQKSSKLVLSEPRVYAEAQEVADHLKNHRAVIVNLQRIDYDQAKRIVDFLSGTVYAIGGDIQRVGADIFLCTPDNVEIDGNISELVKDHDFQNTRW